MIRSHRIDSPPFRLTPVCLFFFALGMCSLWALPQVPSVELLAGVSAIGLVIASLLPHTWRQALLCAVLGLCWSGLSVTWALESRLPPALEGVDLVAQGRIDDLPQRDEDALRFRFCPDRIEQGGQPVVVAGCLRLGWYVSRSLPSASLPHLRAGERWQLTVRLKRPRGLLNPGGFDSERKAVETGLMAVGYVRESGDNQRLSGADGVDALRERIAEWIDAIVTDPRSASLLRGLAIGDRRDFQEADWRMMRRTGVGHLFSISGLHVGMVAIFVGALAAALTWCFPALLRWAPRRYWMLPPALLAALGYALLAGFEVPTRRTVLMIAVAGLALWWRRGVSLWQGWSLALVAVLVLDPMAMTSIGFWLSYLGVACLLLAAQGRARQGMVRTAVQAQWAASIGLLPVGVGFFAQASWVSPLVNLVAIPWITFAVVPLLLLALPIAWMWPLAGAALIQAAEWLLAPLIVALDHVSDWSHAAGYVPEPTSAALACAAVAVVLCLLPLSSPIRWLVIPLLVPLLLPAARSPAIGEVEMHVLDVGQGTAVLLRTHRHNLLFDTGARHANGFDMGQAVVAPALHALGVRRLDALIVSHADNDHAGGAQSIVREFPVARILLGEPVPGIMGGPCHEPERWRWDEVEFQLLHPPPRYPARGNEISCVLKVTSRHGRVLLTGDAGEVAEMRMLNLHREALASDVLLLGHHGSRHSSSGPFLDAVQPSLAIATAGYRNRYGHPQAQVLERLDARGIDMRQTPDTGALHIRFHADGMLVTARRDSHRRFWHEPAIHDERRR